MPKRKQKNDTATSSGSMGELLQQFGEHMLEQGTKVVGDAIQGAVDKTAHKAAQALEAETKRNMASANAAFSAAALDAQEKAQQAFSDSLATEEDDAELDAETEARRKRAKKPQAPANQEAPKKSPIFNLVTSFISLQISRVFKFIAEGIQKLFSGIVNFFRNLFGFGPSKTSRREEEKALNEDASLDNDESIEHDARTTLKRQASDSALFTRNTSKPKVKRSSSAPASPVASEDDEANDDDVSFGAIFEGAAKDAASLLAEQAITHGKRLAVEVVRNNKPMVKAAVREMARENPDLVLELAQDAGPAVAKAAVKAGAANLWDKAVNWFKGDNKSDAAPAAAAAAVSEDDASVSASVNHTTVPTAATVSSSSSSSSEDAAEAAPSLLQRARNWWNANQAEAAPAALISSSSSESIARPAPVAVDAQTQAEQPAPSLWQRARNWWNGDNAATTPATAAVIADDDASLSDSDDNLFGHDAPATLSRSDVRIVNRLDSRSALTSSSDDDSLRSSAEEFHSLDTDALEAFRNGR